MDVVQLMSRELLKGAKMLGDHCEKCGAPLFEKDGEVYCPICKIKGNDKKTEDVHKLEEINIEQEEILDDKINYLLERLKDENEISRIIEIGKALEILLRVRESIGK
ncbi:Sjogren's syndrome/scleroderma autoantigen 1 family protein [Methanotorris igneus]|uniref:Sjogrens syndrome scleroderma autoantigen 1 n=1 Tax=Methanotorris igneus (strain DSM 5666 / JCM 11834 / Kol 5) TaxID=880724 RepID=F6BDJ1_METIK|nr:Sjogren's syndrome/scleroderma autoantigen 1 family protein [Methanotorris igneus]AEF96552.1 Sjogrens syndrome scleroderma autoantigen 1 [Methanotorris igneus Kol 5]